MSVTFLFSFSSLRHLPGKAGGHEEGHLVDGRSVDFIAVPFVKVTVVGKVQGILIKTDNHQTPWLSIQD